MPYTGTCTVRVPVRYMYRKSTVFYHILKHGPCDERLDEICDGCGKQKAVAKDGSVSSTCIAIQAKVQFVGPASSTSTVPVLVFYSVRRLYCIVLTVLYFTDFINKFFNC